MNKTSIEWTDYTANPLKFRTADGRVVWACVKTSPGCTNCYAEHLSTRYAGVRRAGDWNAGTMAGLTPFLDEAELRKMLTYKPAAWKRVFVGDMTDVFGEWVPDELLDRLFAIFASRQDVTWQVLTKRPERMRAYLSGIDVPLRWVSDAKALGVDPFDFDPKWKNRGLANVWLGVSCEDQQRADERIPELLQTPAAVRFISAEPLLGPMDLYRGGFTLLEPVKSPSGTKWPGLDWVIVGGESGVGARPCNLEWIRSLVGQCQAAGVQAFVKQLGGEPYDGLSVVDSHRRRVHTKGKGGDPSEWPEDLRVREFPMEAR